MKALLVLLLLVGLLLPPLAGAALTLTGCVRSPSHDLSLALKQSRTLRVSCSGTSWEGAAVEWRYDGALLASRMMGGSPPASEATVIFDEAGSHEVTATLRGGKGNTTLRWQVEVAQPRFYFSLLYCEATGSTQQTVTNGTPVRLAARCTAPSSTSGDSREFRTVEWFVDRLRERNDTRGGTALDAFHDVVFQTTGTHRIHLVANDSKGTRSIVAWSVEVVPSSPPPSTPPPGTTPPPTVTPSATPPTGNVTPPTSPPTDPTDASGAPDWTTVFTVIAGGITVVGGAIVGVLKLWRSNGEGSTASRRGPPPPSPAGEPAGGAVLQTIDTNLGTVIGSADTVLIGAPGGAGERAAPSGVLPRLVSLYQGLEEAHDHLDDPDAGREVRSARELVRQVMAELERGQRPRAEIRGVTAHAIETALEKGTERVRRGEPALRRVVDQLRR